MHLPEIQLPPDLLRSHRWSLEMARQLQLRLEGSLTISPPPFPAGPSHRLSALKTRRTRKTSSRLLMLGAYRQRSCQVLSPGSIIPWERRVPVKELWACKLQGRCVSVGL